MYRWAIFRFRYFFWCWAVWGYGFGGEAAHMWMTMMQLNDVSIQSQKAYSVTNGPAYDPNFSSFNDAQTMKCTECLLQWLVAMI